MGRKLFGSILLVFTICACVLAGYPTTGVSTPVSTSPAGVKSEPTGTLVATSVAISSNPPSPTVAVTSQPVYDPTQLGDLGNLESYVMSFKSQNSSGQKNGDHADSDQVTLTVINNPFQAEFIRSEKKKATANKPEVNEEFHWYWSGDTVYKDDKAGGFWLIKPTEENDKFYFKIFNMYSAQLKSAHFVGREEINGVSANHFTFDQADWDIPVSDHPPKFESFVGNLYLAVDGNFPLHFDYMSVGNGWVDPQVDKVNGNTYAHFEYRISYDVSSVNQVKAMVLSKEVPIQVKIDIDVPLPPGVKLKYIMAFPHGPPYDYDYFTDLTDDQILAFYQSLQPVNGWTVETVMKDPDGVGGIVNLRKEGKLVNILVGYFEWEKKFYISFQYPR